VRGYIAARVDELTVITPQVLDNFEFALRDIYHGRTSHADIDVVRVATEKTFTDRESNPALDPISGQWRCVKPQDWIDSPSTKFCEICLTNPLSSIRRVSRLAPL
jgi:hypothetical protein